MRRITKEISFGKHKNRFHCGSCFENGLGEKSYMQSREALYVIDPQMTENFETLLSEVRNLFRDPWRPSQSNH